MTTIRTHANLDADLLKAAEESHPGLTRTALLEEALRVLLVRDASLRLAALGGSTPNARKNKKSAWDRA